MFAIELRTEQSGNTGKAVDLLVRKPRFEPEVAIGIAEAIEVSINLAQLVTVPVLDARLRELRHELKTEMEKLRTDLERTKADLIRWVFLTMLGNVALSAGASAVMKAFSN